MRNDDKLIASVIANDFTEVEDLTTSNIAGGFTKVEESSDENSSEEFYSFAEDSKDGLTASVIAKEFEKIEETNLSDSVVVVPEDVSASAIGEEFEITKTEDPIEEEFELLDETQQGYLGQMFGVFNYAKNLILEPVQAAISTAATAVDNVQKTQKVVVEVEQYAQLTQKGFNSIALVGISAFAIYSMPYIMLTYGALLGSTALVDHFKGNQNHEYLKTALIAAPVFIMTAAPMIILPFIVNEFLNPDFGQGLNRVFSVFSLALGSNNIAVDAYNLITGERADIGANSIAALFCYAVTIGYVAPYFRGKDVEVMGTNLSENSRDQLKNYVYGIGDKVFKAGENLVDFVSSVQDLRARANNDNVVSPV